MFVEVLECNEFNNESHYCISLYNCIMVIVNTTMLLHVYIHVPTMMMSLL